MLKSYSTDTHISVIWMDKPGVSGAIEADLIPSEDGKNLNWWIARAVVNPPKQRGKGVGTMMMAELKAKIKDSPYPCIVAPGGYDQNTKQQFNFYIKNGFKKVSNDLLELMKI